MISILFGADQVTFIKLCGLIFSLSFELYDY